MKTVLLLLSTAAALEVNSGLGTTSKNLIKALEENTKKQRSAISKTGEKLAELQKSIENLFKHN